MLASMLGEWRDEMRWPPATGLITERDAIAALNAGRAAGGRTGPQKRKHTPVRSRRGLSIVGAAAAGVLAIGGFGAVVAGAGPGDALYGLRTMLFGAPKQVRDDQVALAAQTQLNQVQDLIAQGDWQQAQDKLVAVSNQVESVGDEEQKQQLLDQWNQLSAKVVQKDPEATVPPGITYTVPPSATELVPAVAPTSRPEVPPTSVPVCRRPSRRRRRSRAVTTTPSEGRRRRPLRPPSGRSRHRPPGADRPRRLRPRRRLRRRPRRRSDHGAHHDRRHHADERGPDDQPPPRRRRLRGGGDAPPRTPAPAASAPPPPGGSGSASVPAPHRCRPAPPCPPRQRCRTAAATVPSPVVRRPAAAKT